jgi:hypothetical protein
VSPLRQDQYIAYLHMFTVYMLSRLHIWVVSECSDADKVQNADVGRTERIRCVMHGSLFFFFFKKRRVNNVIVVGLPLRRTKRSC